MMKYDGETMMDESARTQHPASKRSDKKILPRYEYAVNFALPVNTKNILFYGTT